MIKRPVGSPTISGGFSLIELLVAMAIFLIIGTVSLTLFSQHEAAMSQEQLDVGLNIGLRNALAQLQLDAANAGSGLLMGAINLPAWPVGITIINNPPSAQCNPINLGASPCSPVANGWTPPVYNSTCYDQLNIMLADPNTPALHPCTQGTACTVCTAGAPSSCTPNPAGAPPGTLTGPFIGTGNLASYANNFHQGDHVLFVQACAGGGHPVVNNGGALTAALSSGCPFTTAVLSQAGTAVAPGAGCPFPTGCASLSFSLTNAGGENTSCSIPVNSNTCNDPYNMTTTTANPPPGWLTDTFLANDWVVRLIPITYGVNANHVDSTGVADPQLIRTVGTGQNQQQNVVMDQVIGFKVGAALWDFTSSSSGISSSSSLTSTFRYDYQASDYNCQYDLIRSVRVTLIGRTEPSATNPYQNLFDNGHYLIRSSSIIVDPRNLTMNND